MSDKLRGAPSEERAFERVGRRALAGRAVQKGGRENSRFVGTRFIALFRTINFLASRSSANRHPSPPPTPPPPNSFTNPSDGTSAIALYHRLRHFHVGLFRAAALRCAASGLLAGVGGRVEGDSTRRADNRLNEDESSSR